MSSIRVLHDYMVVREGGAKVVKSLADKLGCPISVGCLSAQMALMSGTNIQTLGCHFQHEYLRAFSVYRRWGKFVCDARTIVYSGHYTPLSVFNHPDSYNIAYCHTPPRFVFDQYCHFLNRVPGAMRPAYIAFLQRYRRRYLAAMGKMDLILTNSRNVKDRIKRYLGAAANVVYPPCETGDFEWKQSDGYFLSAARLDSLKRVDLVIRAFLDTPDKKLIVASDGPERQRLERLANPASNIHFTGMVSDDNMRNLLSRCIATIYIPKDEDFGISPVESMASGKPVIGVADGGLLETIEHEKTGYLLSADPDVSEIIAAVKLLSPQKSRMMRDDCLARATVFDSAVFYQAFDNYLPAGKYGKTFEEVI